MNVFDLMATLSLDRSAYNRGLQAAASEAQSFAGKIGSGLASAAKVAGAALAAAGTAVVSIAKQSLSAYANYEQLVGGVDTLFQRSAGDITEYARTVGKKVWEVEDEWRAMNAGADTVMKNAANAFKTSGLSANEYMETVTSFSASLLQSVGGDTKKAADLADVAIRDMADNANKMGTNMASIQNAYQGFAKQNYTMLDNLKLGYGGTKTEMIRLVEDAEKLNSTFHALRDENGDVALSYGDIVEAIHIVQQNMGITGTTAAEAAGTITGSTASVRAAWQNLLTGLGDDTADIDRLVDDFTESLLTNIGNLAPRIEQIIGGIGRAASKLVPKVLSELIKIVNKNLPSLVDAAKTLIADLGKVLFDNAPALIETVISVISDLATELGTAAPTLLPAIAEGLANILSAISNNAPAFVTAAVTLIQGLASGMSQAAPILLSAVQESITSIIQTIIDNAPAVLGAGLEFVKALIKGMQDNLPYIKEQLPALVSQIADFIANNIGDIVNAGITLFGALIENVSAIIDAITPSLPTLIDGIVDALVGEDSNVISTIISGGVTLFKALVRNVSTIVSAIAEKLPDIVSGIVAALTDPENLAKIAEAAVTLFAALVSNLDAILRGLAQGIKSLVEGIANALLTAVSEYDPNTSYDLRDHFFMGKSHEDVMSTFGYDVVDLREDGKKAGSAMWEGLCEGIGERDEETQGFVRDAAGKLAEATNEELDIHSPSGVFAEIGANMAEGIGVGFAEGMIPAKQLVLQSVLELVAAVRNALGIHSPSRVFAEIGANMARSLAQNYKTTMEQEAAGMMAMAQNGSGTVNHTTQNIYAYQMTPAQALAAAQQQAEIAQFLA